MFIKFENNKIVAWSTAERVEDIIPSSDGFMQVPQYIAEDDYPFLRKDNGIISVDIQAKAAAEGVAQKYSQINENTAWFSGYDNQVAQAGRARRTNSQWSASDGQKTYHTIEELDKEANERQMKIRELKSSLSATNQL